MWVFWVHASNAARFEQAYREIAAQVELPGRDDPKTDILRAVHSWLCDESNGRWLMVVDNADDDRVFASASGSNDLGGDGVDGGGATHAQATGPAGEAEAVAPLASFLPQATSGWILVTSRDLVAAVNLVGARQHVIEVEPMGERDALALLRSKTQVDKSSEDIARALVKTLEGIPLAVTHAAAYIEVNKAMVGIATYLDLFQKSEENQAHLLNSKDARDMRRDASVSSAVITTWQLSFEQIRRTRPEAADLLSLMTMFDRQGIPEHVLYEGKTQLEFVEAVGPLFRFSLVRVQAGTQPDQQPDQPVRGQLLEMHSLVQLATRKWLQSHGQVEVWERASVRIMAAEFPSGEPETWAACRTLLPHSTKLLGYGVEGDKKAKLDRATMATNTGWYLMQMGEYGKAEQTERSAVMAREEMLGREHPNTLISVSHLGSVLERQGKYDEAEAMHQQALEGREKALGQEHPHTLISVSQLGWVLERQGKYEQAEAMHRRALERREKVLGREHSNTLSSVNNLGSVLSSQGKYEEAEAMHRRALKDKEKALGREHPNTLRSISNLGSVLESQGKYKEAEAMHRRALERREKMLGRGHPNTLTSVNNLGSVLSRQGKYEEAEAMHRRVLEGLEKALGREHPHTLTSVSELGSVLSSQGRLADAEGLETRVMDARKRVLGDNHPDTLTAMANLALTLKSQGRSQEALSLIDTCVRARARVLGPGHPDTESSEVTLNRWCLEELELGE
jgi:tetratricopeptide (TPR) repeat protein